MDMIPRHLAGLVQGEASGFFLDPFACSFVGINVKICWTDLVLVDDLFSLCSHCLQAYKNASVVGVGIDLDDSCFCIDQFNL